MIELFGTNRKDKKKGTSRTAPMNTKSRKIPRVQVLFDNSNNINLQNSNNKIEDYSRKAESCDEFAKIYNDKHVSI